MGLPNTSLINWIWLHLKFSILYSMSVGRIDLPYCIHQSCLHISYLDLLLPFIYRFEYLFVCSLTATYGICDSSQTKFRRQNDYDWQSWTPCGERSISNSVIIVGFFCCCLGYIINWKRLSSEMHLKNASRSMLRTERNEKNLRKYCFFHAFEVYILPETNCYHTSLNEWYLLSSCDITCNKQCLSWVF